MPGRRGEPSRLFPVSGNGTRETRRLPSHQLVSGAMLWEQSMRVLNYEAVLSFLWTDNNISPATTSELLEDLDPAEFTLKRKRWPGKR